jgi:hypothetical protein
VGNIATETILEALATRGVSTESEISPQALATCVALSEEIRAKYSHALG